MSWQIAKWTALGAACFAILLLRASCRVSGNLRGNWQPTKDGKTYLSIVNYDTDCRLSCSSRDDASIQFEIPLGGVSYEFNYWGP